MQPVAIDHFKHYQFPANLRSNGAGAVTFVTKRANLRQDRYDSRLWLWQNGTLQALTAWGELDNYWWQDETTLLLARPGDDTDRARRAKGLPRTVLQRLSLNTPGEAEDFLRLDLDVENIECLPGGRLLLVAVYSARVEAALAEAGDDTDRATELLKQQADYEVITELPVWDNGEGFSSGRRRRLYLWDAGTLTPLTDTLTNVEGLWAAPSGSEAFFVARTFDAVYPIHNRLMRLDLVTLAMQDIGLPAPFRHDFALPLPSGALLVSGTNNARYGVNQNPSFYRLEAGTHTPALLDDAGLYDNWSSVLSDLSMAGPGSHYAQGQAGHWVCTVGHSAHLMRIDAGTGAIAQITQQPGAVQEVVFDGTAHYAIALRGLGGPELYRVDDAGGETRLTELNTAIEQLYTLAAPQPLAFTNAEGTEIRGWVLKPPGLKDGRRCPAILSIHGGPKCAFGPVVFHEMQHWAARGWAVLYCNPTGADGRGDAFADIRGRLGTVDYTDLMGFTDAALAAHPWIDPARLAVTGGSYGGFMTNWVVGHTTRFVCAASQRSIASWGTMALSSDIGWYFETDQCAADLLDDPAAVWRQSPLKYANNVTTPTLLLHSDEDYRCPWWEALQFFTALRRNGVETRLVLFRGENHELSRRGKPSHRIRRLQELDDWFTRWLDA